jgi:flagellar hook-associated protein 2
MTMALSTGLISGMDTGGLISQLVAAEAAPQSALKARLSTTQLAASAYRTINTTFLAITAAAETLTPTSLSDGRKASATGNATVTATSTAVPGSKLTFTVSSMASTQTLTSATEWTSATADVRTQEPAWPIDILKNGVSVGTVDVPAGATLTEAAAAINAKDLGLKASVLQLSSGKFRLQLTSEASGSAGALVVKSATEDALTAGSKFLVSTPAQDAMLDLGGGLKATSSSNTFADLMTGVSVTVTKADSTPVTVTVDSDPDAVATKMSTLFDAINSALKEVKDRTSNSKGSTAALKGDASMTMLAGRLLDAVSDAVGTGGAPSRIGIQLTREGLVTFDKAKFVTALKADPALAQQIISGVAAGPGVNGVSGDGDDTAAVTGIASRILDVTKAASNATTGSIVALAKGKDSLVEDMQKRIDSWDLRLAKRKEMLTRQFTAMESALSSLRNQSTWLAGQISSLPTS